MVVGALYRALHAQAWKLAEPSRDRDWPLQPPVPRKTQDRRYLHGPPASQSLESQRQPRHDHHQVEVHKKAGTTEIKLLIQAVTVLAGAALRLATAPLEVSGKPDFSGSRISSG